VNQPISRSLHPIAVLRRLTFQRARLVVALNAGLRRRLIEAGVAPQRIWERPNPVDTDAFFRADLSARRQARESYGLEDAGPVHLLLGRIGARKNQLFALEVLARLPAEHRLLLLGPALNGDQDYVAQVRRRIADLNLEDRVVFRPRHVEDPRRAYHAADCCWIPSTSEGMPNVLLEALVCGLPAVINRALDLDEHIADGINGFAAALEPAAFARCAEAAGTRLAAESCSQQIAATAAQRYGARRIDAEFASRLCEILGPAPAAAISGNEQAMREGK
jgi:glycosyltransferase involved in cell wall biosynthesis